MNDEGVAISISADELMRWEARIFELNELIAKLQAESKWIQRKLEAAKYLLDSKRAAVQAAGDSNG